MNPADTHPLPGQVDPDLTPCAFCRRRIRVNGKQVFQSCCCKTLGPATTIATLVAGAVATVAGLAWVLYQKRK